MKSLYPCPYTGEDHCIHDRCWKEWLEKLEREPEKKARCQAILLMPKSRSWAKRVDREIRCKWSAKPDSPFCGNHAKLSEYITEIIWKEF